MDVLFGYYSDQGVFKDVERQDPHDQPTSTKDDGYDAARTIPNVDELIDSEKVFAMWTLGSPQHAEDLRQDQPALRPPADGDDRPPGLG